MDKNDAGALVTLHDVKAAFGLLTRLPLNVDADRATARGAGAAWAYPLVGLGVAMIACLVASVVLSLGLPASIAAALALAAMIIVTGAMHEDGLADSADGLWGGWDRVRRLAIMKDSHIGAYGVIALILSLLIHWTGLSALMDRGYVWAPIMVMAALSRANMVLVMHAMPNARDTGLAHAVGRPARNTTFIAIGLAAAISFAWIGVSGFVALVVSLCAAGVCALIAHRKVGGQTGDILGATQQVSQMALVVTLVALAP